MEEAHTIFLATDGWHIPIGRGRDHGSVAEILKLIEAQGLKGWLTVAKGDLQAYERPTLYPVHSVGGVSGAEWKAAVEAFYAQRVPMPEAPTCQC